MKQVTVIKLSMKDEKARSKAMKIAAVTQGVTSVAINGADKDLLVVTGDGVDPANLTKSLRDKVGQATIVSVQELGGTGRRSYEEAETEYYYGPSRMSYNPDSYTNYNYPTTTQISPWSSDNYGYYNSQNYPMNIIPTHKVVYDRDPPGCSVM